MFIRAVPNDKMDKGLERQSSPPSEEYSQTSIQQKAAKYKTALNKGGKRLPSYAYEQVDTASDIEFLRKQQSLKNEKLDELQNGGHGKRARTSAKCPPEFIHQKETPEMHDIRKMPDVKIENHSSPKKEELKSAPVTPLTTTANSQQKSRLTVQFNVPPQSAREIFRPPTPIPFMHRVNSLPFVSAPDDPFDNPNDFLHVGLTEAAPFEMSFNTPNISRSNSISQKSIQLDSEYLPPLDLDIPPYQRIESPLSPRMSPSIRERTPIYGIYPIERKKPFYKKTWFYVVMFLLIVLLIIGSL